MVGGYQIIDFDGMLIDSTAKKTKNWERDYSALVSAISNGVPVILKNFYVKILSGAQSLDVKLSSAMPTSSYDESVGKYLFFFPTRSVASAYSISHSIVYFDENGIKI